MPFNWLISLVSGTLNTNWLIEIRSKMKTLWAFWLYKLLVLCELGVAQNNSGSICNVSYAGQRLSVPELCLSAQEAAARLLTRVVNFSLAENGSLIFKPLPPTRQVNVQVEDGSDRLKTWSILANSFIDTVRSGSLPYGTVYLWNVQLALL